MPEGLDRIAEDFQLATDDELRLELLLDYARRLPPLPERYHAERDAGLARVPECMTPVSLWVELEGGTVDLHVDVAEEAPTVKGLLGIIVEACRGATPEEVMALPPDLLSRLGLTNAIRMNRAVGLSAIVARIKRAVARAAGLAT